MGRVGGIGRVCLVGSSGRRQQLRESGSVCPGSGSIHLGQVPCARGERHRVVDAVVLAGSTHAQMELLKSNAKNNAPRPRGEQCSGARENGSVVNKNTNCSSLQERGSGAMAQAQNLKTGTLS